MAIDYQIVTDLGDTDFYEMSSSAAIYTTGTIWKDWNHKVQMLGFRMPKNFPKGFADVVMEQFRAMDGLSFSPEVISYVQRRAPYMDQQKINALRNFRINSDAISVTQQGGEIQLRIVDDLISGMLWEMPAMEVVSEAYNDMMGFKPDPNYKKKVWEAMKRLQDAGARVADFSSRRRFSRETHYGIVEVLSEFLAKDPYSPGFVGTSNVRAALEYNVPFIGTMPHKYIMLMSSLVGPMHANYAAMERWHQAYGYNLGIFLPDTFGLEAFLRTRDLYSWIHAFSGWRHDSGPWHVFHNTLMKLCMSFGIREKTKQMVFSEGLKDVDDILLILEKTPEYFLRSFGTGGMWTRMVGNSISMAVKAVAFQQPGIPALDLPPIWRAQAKLSDDAGKVTADDPNVVFVTQQSVLPTQYYPPIYD